MIYLVYIPVARTASIMPDAFKTILINVKTSMQTLEADLMTVIENPMRLDTRVKGKKATGSGAKLRCGLYIHHQTKALNCVHQGFTN